MEGFFAFSLSQQGKTHVDRGVVCQDYSDTFSDESNAVIAVSDGHGSENFVRSDRGSKYACEAALEAATDFLNSIVVLKQQERSGGDDENPRIHDFTSFGELHKVLYANDQEEVIVRIHFHLSNKLDLLMNVSYNLDKTQQFEMSPNH